MSTVSTLGGLREADWHKDRLVGTSEPSNFTLLGSLCGRKAISFLSLAKIHFILLAAAEVALSLGQTETRVQQKKSELSFKYIRNLLF